MRRGYRICSVDDSDDEAGDESSNGGPVVVVSKSVVEVVDAEGVGKGIGDRDEDMGDDFVDVGVEEVSPGRRSSDTLGSADDDGVASREGECGEHLRFDGCAILSCVFAGFQVVSLENEGDGGKMDDGFVDVAVQEQDVRAARGGHGKTGRSVRKRG